MKVILFGATGMLGQGVLRACLQADDVEAVTIVGRTPSGQSHPKLHEIIQGDLFDYRSSDAGLRGFDACFFCLGVFSAGMSEPDYAHLTYDLTLAAATMLARLNPQMTFVYVSGAGTDSSEQGASMWARVKGRTENALRRLPFKAVYLLRPGAIEPLHGARSKTRSYRLFYTLAAPILPLLRRLWPAAILSTDIIGEAMLTLARSGAPAPVLESKDIYALTVRAAGAAQAAGGVDAAVPDAAASNAARTRRRHWIFSALLLAALVALALSQLGACGSGPAQAAVQASPQWHDGRFTNPEPVWINLRSAFSRMFDDDPASKPSAAAPVAVVRGGAGVYAKAPASGLRVSWFGHSSALVEIDGATVLTDPIWSEMASPVSFAGPRRWYAPALALTDLPRIDAVVVSHDHYDHLDRPTLLALNNGHTRFIVPLGVGEHLRGWGIAPERITELDWWQATKVGPLQVTATPARHSSGRVRPASDTTLWSGFAIAGPAHRVYFSGDTGFFPKLAEIGTRLGPFDVTLIESGQYDPDWPDLHLGPEQAVAANRLVGGKVMIPVHWALFKLAHHPWSEPPERILRAAACAGVHVLIPQPGASVEPGLQQAPLAHWWPAPPEGVLPRQVVATRGGDPSVRFAPSGCTAAPQARN